MRLAWMESWRDASPRWRGWAIAVAAPLAILPAAPGGGATVRPGECTKLWPTCMQPTLPAPGCFAPCLPGTCPPGFRCSILFATNVAHHPGGGGCPGFAVAVCLPPPAEPDVNRDGAVDEIDLVLLVEAWGECAACGMEPCRTDLVADCRTGAADLLALLSAWTR